MNHGVEYKVRLVEKADVPAILALGEDLHRENGLMPLSRARIEGALLRALNRDITGCVIGPVGAPEALMLLTIGQFWYSDKQHLEELFVYVDPRYRSSTRARALLEYAKRCSDELGVPLLIGAVSNIQTKAKMRLYRKVFGEISGFYFLHNGKAGG